MRDDLKQIFTALEGLINIKIIQLRRLYALLIIREIHLNAGFIEAVCENVEDTSAIIQAINIIDFEISASRDNARRICGMTSAGYEDWFSGSKNPLIGKIKKNITEAAGLIEAVKGQNLSLIQDMESKSSELFKSSAELKDIDNIVKSEIGNFFPG